MKYLSLFSGIEAATVAWHPLGWEPVGFSEIEPFPCAVLKHHYPQTKNYGDVTRFQEWDVDPFNLVIGGSPCFVAGTLVLTREGYKPIEGVKVGDMVVTHKGRLRKVLRIGGKTADTIILKGQGTDGIECTAEHPFYSRSCGRRWDSERRGYDRTYSDPEWTNAEDMKGRYWLNVSQVEPEPIPEFGDCGHGESGKGLIEDFKFSEAFFYFVGRWLGDGWANSHKRIGRKDSHMKKVYVCAGYHKTEKLEEILPETGLHFTKSDERTARRYICSSTQLHDWLIANFGVKAHGKNVPTWCLGMPSEYRRAMFQGYLDSDGSKREGKWKTASVCKPLLMGMKALAGSLGMAASLVKCNMKPQTVIEGRTVNQRPLYNQSYYDTSRSAFFEDCGWYGLVRKKLEGNSNVKVYNLEVEEDNSYAADGIAVHNCQSFSVAGLRKGLADPRGNLMLTYLAVADKFKPKWLIWENVPGVLSSNGGKDFGTFLGALGELGYGFAYRICDAVHFGVPQRRRRVFVVGYLGDWRPAAAVLFESFSLSGHPPPSRKAREGTSEGVEGGVGEYRSCTGENIAPCVTSKWKTGYGGPSGSNETGNMVMKCSPYRMTAIGEYADDDKAFTLKARDYKDATDLIAHAFKVRGGAHQDQRIVQPVKQVVGSLTANMVGCQGTPGYNETEHILPVQQPRIGSHWDDPTNPHPTLNQSHNTGGIGASNQEVFSQRGSGLVSPMAFNVTFCDANGRRKDRPNGGLYVNEADQSSTLTKAGIGTFVVPPMAVRRLTPTECERLQGFPDSWTNIPWRNKPDSPDGPRYKALGNSFAVPVVRWLGMRIQLVENLMKDHVSET